MGVKFTALSPFALPRIRRIEAIRGRVPVEICNEVLAAPLSTA